MQFLGIVGTCVLASVAYGIIHDQITVRVCLEYFTVFHPKIIESQDPTILGLAWGVYATWWAGLILGLGLATTARLGSRPKRSLASLRRPIFLLLGLMAGFALVTGVIAYMAGSMGTILVPKQLLKEIPPQKHAAFQTCLVAHNMSYNVAFVGGGMMIAWVWISRKRLPRHAIREGKSK
jgi:hypothetical protein